MKDTIQNIRNITTWIFTTLFALSSSGIIIAGTCKLTALYEIAGALFISTFFGMFIVGAIVWLAICIIDPTN